MRFNSHGPPGGGGTGCIRASVSGAEGVLKIDDEAGDDGKAELGGPEVLPGRDEVGDTGSAIIIAEGALDEGDQAGGDGDYIPTIIGDGVNGHIEAGIRVNGV